MTGIAIVFASVGEFEIIAAVTDFAVYLVFLAVNGSVVILRRTHPDLSQPFAVAGAIRGIPVLPVLGLGSVALMMTQLEPVAITVDTAACLIRSRRRISRRIAQMIAPVRFIRCHYRRTGTCYARRR